MGMTLDINGRAFTVLLPTSPDGVWQRAVSAVLLPQGIHTVEVRTGREALGMIEQRGVDVAVLDASMPQLGGMQVVELLAKRSRSIPSILLSDSSSSGLMQQALRAGVFCVLPKPVEVNAVLDSIARVLKRIPKNQWPRPTMADEPT